MADFYKLRILKSGASDNNLGGVISSTRMFGQTAIIPMSGVGFEFAYDNPIGVGILYFFKNGDTVESGTDGIENPSDIDAVPGMTSYTTPSGEVTSQSPTEGHAWYVFDNSLPGHWQDTTTGTERWIAYEFTSAKKINKYTLRSRADTAGRVPANWEIQGWTGSVWDTLHTVTNEPQFNASEKRGYTFTNGTAYIKYRLWSNDGGFLSLAEMELIENQATVTADSDCLVWRSLGGYKGTQVNVESNGIYPVESYENGGTLVVNVTSASLPSTADSESVTVSQVSNEFFDDISYTEAYDGDTEYRCVYLKNTDTVQRTVNVWLGVSDTGGASIEIGLDPSGVNGTAQIIQNESVPPAGVTFSAPVTQGTSLEFVLNTNQYHSLWIKRTIAAGTKPEYSDRVEFIVTVT